MKKKKPSKQAIKEVTSRTRALALIDEQGKRLDMITEAKKPTLEQEKATKYLMKALNISYELARTILTGDQKEIDDIMKEIKPRIDFKSVKLMEKLQRGIADKIKDGKMRQARAGATAFAILYDKLFKPAKEFEKFKIGEGFKIKLEGWKFSPYKRK